MSEYSVSPNLFRAIIEELRDAGLSWNEILDQLDEAYDGVDAKALDESEVEYPARRVVFVTKEGGIDEGLYIIQDDESQEEMEARINNASAVSNVVRVEDGHTVSVLE